MSNESEPVTFDEARDEKNSSEDREGHPEEALGQLQNNPDLSFDDLEGEFGDVESFLETLPDKFGGGGGDVVAPPTSSPGDRFEIINEIDIPQFDGLQDLLSGIGEGLNEIGQINDTLEENLGDLGTRGLMVYQATALKGILTAFEINNRISLHQSQVQINQLQALFDILSSVEPITGITVSGRNVINDPGSPQPVVPESDSTDIPTRHLLVQSAASNNEDIAFGDDEVDPQNGFILTPGNNIMVPVDLRATELYMASEEKGAEVGILGGV